MPTFTVIVKDDDTKTERIVTVNTATMEATIVAAPVAEQTVASVAMPVTEPAATSVTEPVSQPAVEIPVTPENNALSGLTGLFNEKKTSGGKRSTPSFRLKKRRITRKHKKTR